MNSKGDLMKKKREKKIHNSGAFSFSEDKMKKCYACGGKLILAKDLIIKNGKSFPIQVQKCNKCGEVFSTLEEAERVRRELYPSLLDKVKRLFHSQEKIEVSWVRGKVL